MVFRKGREGMKGIGLLFTLWMVFAGFSVANQKYEPRWESLDKRPIPRWFLDAKFGIFIHWGVYSVPAWRKVTEGRYASYAEWYYARVMFDEESGGREFHARNFGEDFEYRDFAPLFRAELFDADYWAELFSRSGAKYVVLTAKHHDGYCLWPTKSPYKKGWNSMDVGPKRDLVGDLTEAVRAKGLRMGLYYSLIEWESNRTHRTESGYFIPRRQIC
jgi:alpha-L-fucosidase